MFLQGVCSFVVIRGPNKPTHSTKGWNFELDYSNKLLNDNTILKKSAVLHRHRCYSLEEDCLWPQLLLRQRCIHAQGQCLTGRCGYLKCTPMFPLTAHVCKVVKPVSVPYKNVIAYSQFSSSRLDELNACLASALATATRRCQLSLLTGSHDALLWRSTVSSLHTKNNKLSKDGRSYFKQTQASWSTRCLMNHGCQRNIELFW